MDKFPLITKLGLRIFQEYGGICSNNQSYVKYLIRAEDLEAALEKATVVYSVKIDDNFNRYWGTSNDRGVTHKALLINVEELPREPLKHEFYSCDLESSLFDDVFKKYKSEFKGKKVRVKIEEIRE